MVTRREPSVWSLLTGGVVVLALTLAWPEAVDSAEALLDGYGYRAGRQSRETPGGGPLDSGRNSEVQAEKTGKAALRDAGKTQTLDEILKAVATYDGGIDSAAMWKLRDYVYARKDTPAGRAECEAKLLQFLKSPATPAARMAACRYLRVIAGETAVPALQMMLADERSADMALYALQHIPGEAADRALMGALKAATGPTKIAIVTALGERKTAAAVPSLVPLLLQPAWSGAAAIAIGRIGGDAAAAALVAAYPSASVDLKPVVASSMLVAAEQWMADKNTAAARRLYDTLASDASLPIPLRKAAWMGRISTSGNGAGALLLDLLRGSDPDMQEAAIALIEDVFTPEAIGPVCALLPGLSETAQVQVLAVLAGYPADPVLSTILQAAQSVAVPVRIGAIKALASTGGPSVVPFLAEATARARGPEHTAARSALGTLKGRAVDEAIVRLLGQQVSDGVAEALLIAVADRRIFPAKGVVAASLTSISPRIRVQALKALRAIGTPSDIPAVLDLLLRTADESERGEAGKTTATLAQTMASQDGRSGAVKTRLAAERDPELRVRLVNILPLIGDSSALPILRTTIEDTNAEVADAAVRAIVEWPTAAAHDDIRQLARNSRNETHRLLAIRGLVRSVGLEPYRNQGAAVADLKLAAEFAWRPEEYALILGALTSFPSADALAVAHGFLREPSVQAEAQSAVDSITKNLSNNATR